jgi:protease-4
MQTAGSPFKPETPEERAYIQGLIDTSFAEFKRVVMTARPKVDFTVVGSGKVFLAPDAMRLGLIDQVGYPDDAYKKAAASAATALSKPKVVRYEENPPGLLDLLVSRSSVGPGQAKGVTVNGVNVNVDANTITELLCFIHIMRGDDNCCSFSSYCFN